VSIFRDLMGEFIRRVGSGVIRLRSVTTLRHLALLGYDAAATAVALTAAVFLRFDGTVPDEWLRKAKLALPALLGLRLAVIFAGGLHRWSFRVCGIQEALRLVMATLAGTALFSLLVGDLVGLHLPRTVIALEFFFTTTLLAAVRFAPRIGVGWYAELARARTSGVRRTLIVGAGGAADLLARDLRRSSTHNYHLIGFVDDNPNKMGAWLDGKPVLGRIDDLPALIEEHRISMVLLAIAALPAERIRHILSLCARQKASFKIIPASFAFLDGRISAAMLHDLSPEDLLPRDQVVFDANEIRGLVDKRRILITGAAGSIGGEIARQVAEHGARMLVLVDVNENDLYLGARELKRRHPEVAIHAEVADIRERERLERLAERYRPEYVFHAAAHKHVPLMEDAPEEAVKNNVFGTLNVARMAHECGAERFVFISTDKAVKPSSVMGASKRVAEILVRDLARASPTRMTCVRFGNVLGSAGSVVPLFKQQIERGGPVTVTHPDCTRFFMTISEAVGLVILAGLAGANEICILDMGEAIKIADLAAHLITLAGKVPGVEIPIVFTGLRPGEKVHEELLTEEEERTQVLRNRIKAAKSPPPPADLAERLEELRRAAERGDRSRILGVMQEIVPSCRWATTEKPASAPAPVALRVVSEAQDELEHPRASA
jgi:FlaA1/EpsC-like NDP-sugar epimerase